MTTSLLLALAGLAFPDPAPEELTYSGRLTPVSVTDKAAAEEGFTLVWFVPRAAEGGECLFAVAEDASALPWPSRFGFCPPEGGDSGPQMGYRFADRDHVVPLPGVRLKGFARLAVEAEVVDGPHRLSVVGEKKVGDRDCRVVEVSTNFGKQATVAVEKGSGLIVREEQTVFLGRGDRFRLTLELTNSKPLNEHQTATLRNVANSLREIAALVGQGERDPATDLPADLVTKISASAGTLNDVAKDTAFQPLVAAITRDLADQQDRREGVAGLAKKSVNSPAPSLALKDLDGGEIDPTSLQDKVVVLHFWDYDNDSLAAPYGQVGYLDFLHRKRANQGVAVVGVAVNKAFGDPAARGRAVRSAKNLAGFMNLGYPLAGDDGTLLRAFGDPRTAGAILPLWVVIDAAGTVRLYKAGVYDLKQNEGLSELDSEVVRLLKEKREHTEQLPE